MKQLPWNWQTWTAAEREAFFTPDVPPDVVISSPYDYARATGSYGNFDGWIYCSISDDRARSLLSSYTIEDALYPGMYEFAAICEVEVLKRIYAAVDRARWRILNPPDRHNERWDRQPGHQVISSSAEALARFREFGRRW